MKDIRETNWTLQEIFDFACQHLAKQGKSCVSVEDHTVCLYRGPDNMKCVYGAFIPDEEYKPEMEGETVSALCASKPYDQDHTPYEAPAIKGNSKAKNLMNDLQDVHDGRLLTRDTKRDLLRVANNYGLDASAVELITSFNEKTA